MTTFTLRRTSELEGLQLTRVHEAVVSPERGPLPWDAFDPGAFDAARVADAADAWLARARTEYRSFTHFSQLLVGLQRVGAPLDWCGAMTRMVADELRHADLCLRFTARLGGPAALADEALEGQRYGGAGSLLEQLRFDVLATFCVAETLSVRMFTRCLEVATVPLAKAAVTTILADETRHRELGWELGALLLRPTPGEDVEASRRALEAKLPALFEDLAGQCCALEGRAAAFEGDDVEPGDNFGTLRPRGYARCFYEGLDDDVVPGLEAIGLTGAPSAWAAFAAARG